MLKLYKGLKSEEFSLDVKGQPKLMKAIFTPVTKLASKKA